MSTILTSTALNARGKLRFEPMQVEQGELLLISGQSGCGKSTLLRLCNGSLLPDSGEITFKGKLLSQYAPLELRRDVLLVLQRVYLMQGSIEENFESFYQLCSLPVPSKEKREQYLKLCCFSGDESQLCSALSGGEQQRVYLAIMLSFEPSICLLDEPTASLDPQTATQFMHNLKHWMTEKDITTLMVSHDTSLQSFADRVLNLMPSS